MKTDLSCDIIRDLLPSYVDGICSEATRDCVDTHLHDCPACQALTRQLRDTALTAKKLEEREFDALKKVKRQIGRESLAGVLLAFALVFSALMGRNLLVRDWGARADNGFYLLLALCILTTVNFVRSRKPGQPAGRIDRLIAVVSLAVTGWTIVLVFYCLQAFIRGGTPFPGVPQIGLFVRYQLDGGAVLQMLFFALLLWRLVKGKVNNAWILPLCLTGACISLLYENHLGSMDLSYAVIDRIIPLTLNMTVTPLSGGLAGVILMLLLTRPRSKSGD